MTLPPFSDKSWSDGIKTTADTYQRFDGYGTPPGKNGDYAWFLHVLKSLNSEGKAGIIMPHGVLFRGNAEETIRNAILEKKYIKGIVSLPANLFYGTGIPVCIILIDKENADKREGIFVIDASQGYKKDGNKNRLREQDIEAHLNGGIPKTDVDSLHMLWDVSPELKDIIFGNYNPDRKVYSLSISPAEIEEKVYADKKIEEEKAKQE